MGVVLSWQLLSLKLRLKPLPFGFVSEQFLEKKASSTQYQTTIPITHITGSPRSLKPQVAPGSLPLITGYGPSPSYLLPYCVISSQAWL